VEKEEKRCTNRGDAQRFSHIHIGGVVLYSTPFKLLINNDNHYQLKCQQIYRKRREMR
jgi:hypothetical protein